MKSGRQCHDPICHSVTLSWHWANQSLPCPINLISHWFDSTVIRTPEFPHALDALYRLGPRTKWGWRWISEPSNIYMVIIITPAAVSVTGMLNNLVDEVLGGWFMISTFMWLNLLSKHLSIISPLRWGAIFMESCMVIDFVGLFVVLRHNNSISVISWRWYDVWDEKEKARAYTFNDLRDL